jgi:hypothetical protein
VSKKNKFYLEADIKIEKETSILKEKASKVIDLPEGEDKQPDLQYFSAVFVSSGENLNHAYFLPSELILAENTIVNKALDIEHQESQIIGHIYDRVFTTKEGASIDLKELADLEKANLDKKEIHIAIAGIVYKDRFPNVASEIADKKWKVSMECYFKDFDVKIGNLVISRKEAEALGLVENSNSVFGKLAKVIKDGIDIASGKVTRVLRGICFSGCGIVKHPANPVSVVLETANVKKEGVDIILDYDKIDLNSVDKTHNNVTSDKTEGQVSEIIENKKDSELKEEGVGEVQDPLDSKHLKQDIKSMITASLEKLITKKKKMDKRKKLMDKLSVAMDKVDEIKH